ncbi:MAG: potassium transporter [Gammaproteobacteria bacterium]|nr:MAG: potassium transporter [Gammaproteobacteria bacterium]
MRLVMVQKILGLLLMVFSLTMIPPMVVSIWTSDHTLMPFIYGFLITFGIGAGIWFPVRNSKALLRVRDGFLIVVLFWTVLGMCGGTPFMFAEDPHMHFTDAVFESISGMTTTGATVLTHIEKTKEHSGLSNSILYYRQQLQWWGGMGIIVLAVAILPLLGIGGMQLYKAETPGPMKDAKLTPRIKDTAKALWYIYLGITFACAFGYWTAGMTWFDAIGHSFATVANGGFSTHDASMGYFNSPAIEWVSIFFMVVCGANFALHYVAIRSGSIKVFWKDPEFKAYIFILLGVSTAIAIVLIALSDNSAHDNVIDVIRTSIFHTVSIGTTAGFATENFAAWPLFVPVLLMCVGFIAGCSGSTAGGIKTIRALLLYKQGKREILRVIHPNAQIPVKLGEKSVQERVIDAVWGFFAIYVIMFVLMMLALLATKVKVVTDGAVGYVPMDLETSFSAVAACVNNVGPGLGKVAVNFANLSPLAKWILTFAMLLGRLEVFPLLVIITPAFWRR